MVAHNSARAVESIVGQWVSSEPTEELSSPVGSRIFSLTEYKKDGTVISGTLIEEDSKYKIEKYNLYRTETFPKRVVISTFPFQLSQDTLTLSHPPTKMIPMVLKRMDKAPQVPEKPLLGKWKLNYSGPDRIFYTFMPDGVMRVTAVSFDPLTGKYSEKDGLIEVYRRDVGSAKFKWEIQNGNLMMTRMDMDKKPETFNRYRP